MEVNKNTIKCSSCVKTVDAVKKHCSACRCVTSRDTQGKCTSCGKK